MKLRGALLGIALLAAGATAGVAHSAEAGFTLLDAGTAVFPDRAFVVTLVQQRRLDSSDVTVTEDGKTVPGAAVQSAASAAGIGTVLLIDASNSMRGKPTLEAVKAARAFASRNPNQPLAIISFNDRVTTLLPFTTDRKAVATALAKIPVNREGTHIYDAVSLAVAAITNERLGAGRIVLLSDGQEVGSTISREEALRLAVERGVRIYTVGLQSYAFDAGYLRELSADTSATYAEATSPGDLSRIYDQLGYRFVNEYLLRYRSPARPGTDVDVAVSIKGIANTATFSYATPNIGSAIVYRTPLIDRVLQSWLSMVAIAVLIVALVAYALGTGLAIHRNHQLRRRLSRFVSLDEGDAKARREEVESLLAQVSANRLRFGDWKWTARLAVDLELAGINLAPQNVAVLALAGALLVASLCAVFIAPFWVLAGFLVPVLVRAAISRRAARTRSAFDDQLPSNLEVLGSALRAGHSLVGAISVVVDEAAEPSRNEFRRVVTDEQLGIPLDETLELTARRMDSRDMEQLAVVAVLQREAGGNMAEVLDRVVENIRGRHEVRRLVRTLTAQGRLSRLILSGLPVVITFAILLLNPDHLDPLFHRTVGQVALVMAAIMVIVGSLVINKIIKIRI